MKKTILQLLYILLLSSAENVMAQGFITTVAGLGPTDYGYNGDGIYARHASLSTPAGVFVTACGDIYIADLSNNRVRKIDAATGLISTVAGNGTAGFSGDGMLAVQAQLDGPMDVCLDSDQNIYISDCNNHRIRKVDAATGIITTIVGTGMVYNSIGNTYPYYYCYGDSASAIHASLYYPSGICLDNMNNLYIADTYHHRVRKVDASTNIITTIVGTQDSSGILWGYNGDNIIATKAQLCSPQSVHLDVAGNMYIADKYNNRIRKVNAATGIITTVAGNADTSVALGDNGAAVNAKILYPDYVSLDANSNMYISESGIHIRKVDAVTGIITTYAGNDIGGYNGDDMYATKASLTPIGTCMDAAGNLYIAEAYNNLLRKVIPTPTNIAELEMNEEVRVYPNPSTGLFTVKMGNNIHATRMMVYDMLGRQVYTTDALHDSVTIDLSAFPSAPYTLYINTPEKAITRRLVVDK